MINEIMRDKQIYARFATENRRQREKDTRKILGVSVFLANSNLHRHS